MITPKWLCNSLCSPAFLRFSGVLHSEIRSVFRRFCVKTIGGGHATVCLLANSWTRIEFA